MGENGAGKSTLIKVLTGVYAIDAGQRSTLDGAGGPLRRARCRRSRRGEHRLPGGQPLRQPLGRGEHLHRPGAALVRRGSSWGAMRRRAARAAGPARPRHRRDRDARHLLAGHAADGGDRPGHRHRGQGPDPGRAHLQPRRRRGGPALPDHAPAQGPGHRDPVRHPLPRPGLRDRRPDHRAAQRPAGGGVPRPPSCRSSPWSRR